ncbi:MAG TPA: hypothetical protein VJ735_05640 [Actinomycetes bacterium]|nr:hypothetical protein [Actinomycetes bacterium]
MHFLNVGHGDCTFVDLPSGRLMMIDINNFRRTYHGALAKLANPATAGLRPTAARVLGVLRHYGPLTANQLAAQLSSQGRTASMATIDWALADS